MMTVRGRAVTACVAASVLLTFALGSGFWWLNVKLPEPTGVVPYWTMIGCTAACVAVAWTWVALVWIAVALVAP